ncbi:hypothetical protein SOHN41_03582 [Shewanella sp. HN-41]|nr:hypothetical protein SOHN41_03582 [Shewanella sp. HN-41]
MKGLGQDLQAFFSMVDISSNSIGGACQTSSCSMKTLN